MPCYTVTMTKLELKNANLDLLKGALMRLGYHPQLAGTMIRWENGEYINGNLRMYGADGERKGQEIRQAYSGEITRSMAAKMGWKVRQVAANRYQLVK